VFSCDIHNTDTETLVTASGEVDLATRDQLWDVLRSRVTPGARIVLDCSGITFIDCSGLRVLVWAQQRAEASGGQLVLDAPSAPLLRILELAGVTDTFNAVGDARPSIPRPAGRRIGNRSGHLSSAAKESAR
jgi:anti-anti-sigma factor